MDYNRAQNFEDPRDNLNLENWGIESAPQASPEAFNPGTQFNSQPMPGETLSYNPQNIGNKAIISSNISGQTEPSDAKMGQIIDLTPPPVSTTAGGSNAKNLDAIVGNSFSHSALSEVRRAENELGQTGNIDNFYEEIRGMSKLASERWAA